MFTIYPQLLCSRWSLHFDGHTIVGAAEGGWGALRLEVRGWAGHLDWTSPPQQRQHIAVILKTCFFFFIVLLLLAKTFHIHYRRHVYN